MSSMYIDSTGFCTGNPSAKSIRRPFIKKQQREHVNSTAGDRFIPTRANLNPDLARSLLSPSELNRGLQDSNAFEYNASLREALFDDRYTSRVLSFSCAKRAPLANFDNKLKTLYGYNRHDARYRFAIRSIKTSAYKVLDAPQFVPDFYLNLLDWSSLNILAVALNRDLHLYKVDAERIVASLVC
jgi:cell division cycle protein 20 (cofactor of APC complex)